MTNPGFCTSGRERESLSLLCRSRVRNAAATVAAHPRVGLLSVDQEAFEHAQTRAVLANPDGGLIGQQFLVGTGLKKLADPETTGVSAQPSFELWAVLRADSQADE